MAKSPEAIVLGIGLIFLVLWPRLLNLGSVVINDEPIWKGRAHRYIVGIATWDPVMTFSGGQPGVTTMIFAGLADQFHSWPALKAAIAIPVSFGLLLSIVLLGRLTTWQLAAMAGVILALDPFLIAHSRLVHTDALLASFMLVTLLLLALAWQMHSRRYLFLAAVAAVLAVLTKFFALWLPLVVLAASFSNRFGQGNTKVKRVGLLCLLMLAVAVVIWPTLLTPAEPISIITKYAKLSAAETEVGKGGGTPYYYLREFWFRVTPVTAVFGTVGLLGFILGGRKSLPVFQFRRLFLFLIICALGYGLLLTFSGQKSDRYFLLGFMVADIVAAGGLIWLAELVSQLVPRWNFGKLVLGGGIVLAAILAWDVSYIHPYYLAYFNPLYPVTAQQKLGWGEGLERAAAWIARKTPEGAEHPFVAVAYAFVLREFYPGPAESIGHEYDNENYKYVVLYRTMFGRGPNHESTRYLSAYFTRGTCDWQLTVNGLPHVWIFERLPEAERPTEERDKVVNDREIQLPACLEIEEVASPAARWVL